MVQHLLKCKTIWNSFALDRTIQGCGISNANGGGTLFFIISRLTTEEIPHTYIFRHPFSLHDPIQGCGIYIANVLCSDVSLDIHLKCCGVFHFTINILTHWGRDKMAAIFQTTFSNAFSWMKMHEFRLRFHWSLFLRLELTIFQHWSR